MIHEFLLLVPGYDAQKSTSCLSYSIYSGGKCQLWGRARKTRKLSPITILRPSLKHFASYLGFPVPALFTTTRTANNCWIRKMEKNITPNDYCRQNWLWIWFMFVKDRFYMPAGSFYEPYGLSSLGPLEDDVFRILLRSRRQDN